MLRLPLIVALFTMLSASGQLPLAKPYWQQKLVYTIAAKVLPQQHAVDGTLHLQYSNQSPDTLRFIWFHLWPNAHASDSTAMASQIKQLQLPQFSNVQKHEGPGYITGLNWQVDGVAAQVEKHGQWNDVIKLLLPAPLLPGTSCIITTPFLTQLPAFAFRSGYVDTALFVAHWYPKPAVYDHQGWHPMPFLEMGEYYSEFGRYNVDLTLPSNYIVAATGTLQNTDELQQYRQLGHQNHLYTDSIWKTRMNIRDPVVQQGLVGYQTLSSNTSKTLRFYADSVHDFAFFTDPRFIIDYDTVRLLSGSIKDVFSFYLKGGFLKWNAAVEDAKSALLFYSLQVGQYPYGTISIVQGPESENYAGIEYPTITLILTGNTAGDELVESVIAHEVGHNWFYGILASNEREYGWMDEGFNTFFEQRYGAEKNRYAPALRFIPETIRGLSAASFEEYLYEAIDGLPYRSPIYQPATNFTDQSEYYVVTYFKTASWLYALEQKIGKATFARCIKAYYSRWKFRHPYPKDLFKVFEEVSGQNLSGFFKQLLESRQRFNTKK